MKKFRSTKCMKKLISIIVMCAMLAGCSQQGTLDEIAAMTADTEVTTAVTANAVTTEPVITTAAATTTVEKTTATEKVTTTEEVTTAPVTTTTAPAPVTTTNTPAPAPAVTTTTVVTTTTTPAPEVVPTSSDIEVLLNGAKLNPIKTNEPDLDSLVDDLLNQITTSGMSTYQKVVSIYKYMINTYSYVMPTTTWSTDVGYNSFYDCAICSRAATLIMEKKGVCNHYAALFTVLTRRIGLESYVVSGEVPLKSGGTTGHNWTIIKLNGGYYVFDPQVEQDNLVNGSISYSYFGKSEASMSSVYVYGVSGTLEICAMFYQGEIGTVSARDLAILLFNNFELAEDGKCPYEGWTIV